MAQVRFVFVVVMFLALVVNGCVPKEKAGREEMSLVNSDEEVKKKLDETLDRLSFAEDLVNYYASFHGGLPPPNPPDTPFAKADWWKPVLRSTWAKGASRRDIFVPGYEYGIYGYLAPDMPEYLYESGGYDMYDKFFGSRKRLADPFSPKGMPFGYVRLAPRWGTWRLFSVGPDGVQDVHFEDIVFNGWDGFELYDINLMYDPTNGIRSTGDLFLASSEGTAYREVTRFKDYDFGDRSQSETPK